MKKKVIALIIAIIIFIVIAGIVFAIYLQNDNENNNNNISQVQNNNSNVQQTNGMILINGDTFQMGSLEDEMQRETDEVQHEVTVNDFYISATEVSQKEYGEKY